MAVLEKYMVAVTLAGETGNVERVLNYVGLRFDDKFCKFVRSLSTTAYHEKELWGLMKKCLCCTLIWLFSDVVTLCITLLFCCIREEPALQSLDRGDFRDFFNAMGIVVVDPDCLCELYDIFKYLKNFQFIKVRFYTKPFQFCYFMDF